MAEISIITPWLNHHELMRTYEPSVKGAEVIIIDNGSDKYQARHIKDMVHRLEGIYIRNDINLKFAPANNQGLEKATKPIIMFLNNDIEAPAGWLERVEQDVKPGALYGPNKSQRPAGGKLIDYIEGFCIAGTRDTWDLIGGWPDDLPGMYWEDNILCWKAQMLGIELINTRWPVWHFNNYTSANTAGAYEYSQMNQSLFVEMVQNG